MIYWNNSYSAPNLRKVIIFQLQFPVLKTKKVKNAHN